MIGAHVEARIVLAAIQLIGTFGGAGGAGLAVSQHRASDEVRAAENRVETAHAQFRRAIRVVLEQGTPLDDIRPIEIVERALYQRPRPDGGLLRDRYELTARAVLARQIGTLVEAAYAAEIEAAESLRGRLRRLTAGYRDDLEAARASGMAIDAYEAMIATVDAELVDLDTPSAEARRIEDLSTSQAALRAATANQVANNEAAAAAAAALDAARGAANYEHDRALGDLARARAIQVLDVAAPGTAIKDLESKLAAAVTVDDFGVVAAAFRDQALWIETLLAVRADAYGRLARAERAVARASAAGADTHDIAAQLAGAANQLAAAGAMAAILGASTVIQSVIVQADAAYAYSLAHPPPPAGAREINMPYHAQVYSLSCEAAALQMALGHEGIERNQDQILAAIGVDRRAPELDGSGNLVHWSDPYTAFVGDPNGFRESARYGDRSGYGTYFPTIASAATSFGGTVLAAGEGTSTAMLYDMAAQGHPAVVWVPFDWTPRGTTTYQAWDGRTVMYGAPWEHAVTIAGVADAYVLIDDPHAGQYWKAKSAFEAAYSMFNRMAVVLS